MPHRGCGRSTRSADAPRRRRRVLLLAIAALVAVTGCGTPVSPSTPGTPATTSPPARTPTPVPTSVSAVVTADQVAAVGREAARQGAVVTFARTDPSGIVVVRPRSARGSNISSRSLAAVVHAQDDPTTEVKVASTGTARRRLSEVFEHYAANNSRPGVYLTFAYRKEHSVFTLATNAPVQSLRSFLQEHGDELVVTYASPGCQVCGG